LIHRYGRYLRITEDHVERAHAWFRRAGHWSLTFGYFIPGVRHFTAYAAGMSELEYPPFALFAYGGAAVWVSTFIGLGYLLGERWKAVEANIHHYMIGFTIAAVILVAAYLVWRSGSARRATGLRARSVHCATLFCCKLRPQLPSSVPNRNPDRSRHKSGAGWQPRGGWLAAAAVSCFPAAPPAAHFTRRGA
jgi:hypothetical protein